MIGQLNKNDQPQEGDDQDRGNKLQRFCPEPESIIQKVVDNVPQIQHQEHDPSQIQEPSVLLLGWFSWQDGDVLDRTGGKWQAALDFLLRANLQNLVDADLWSLDFSSNDLVFVFFIVLVCDDFYVNDLEVVLACALYDIRAQVKPAKRILIRLHEDQLVSLDYYVELVWHALLDLFGLLFTQKHKRLDKVKSDFGLVEHLTSMGKLKTEYLSFL